MNDRTGYFALVSGHPELFANPPGPSIEILLGEDEIRQAEATVAERLAVRGLPTEWARVGIAYQDQYLLILRDAVRFPDGSLGTYIRAVSANTGTPGVVILPVCKGNVVLVRHFRHGSRAWHWEIPRGFGEVGFTAEDNARRELEEEIGAAGTRLTPMGPVNLDTDASGSPDELFYAEIESYGRPDVAEGIAELRAVSLAEFQRMIAKGEISEGYTLAAYARAKALELM
jgi:ADP-ribose pyrophosphatase